MGIAPAEALRTPWFSQARAKGEIMVRRVPVAAATSAALLVVGLAAGYGGPKRAAVVSAYAAPALVWAACQNPPVPPHGKSKPPSNLECAKLAVPLDYAQPGGEKIRIALIRVKATDQPKRIGSLLFNFGGPGVSGVALFAAGAASGYKRLGTRYDLVSFDPRGVGQSDPVNCLQRAVNAYLLDGKVPADGTTCS
ncbi:MAG: peptidase [Actinomycetia bacterium]|nr:peptidase [Actinomycetes bacterium]